jgi:DNA-binding response OmpR family regulator
MAPKRILIVDDALELGRLLKATLTTLDHTLEIAVVPSAEEGHVEAGKKPVDLLVTDLRLPGVSGTDLIKVLRKKNPQLKVILITGVSEAQISQESKDVKVDYFLKKPMEIADFLAAAKKCLGMEDASVGAEVAAKKEGAKFNQMSAMLEAMRTNVNAHVVCLFDEQGNVIVKCGEYPEKNFETKWIPSILSSLLADARVLHQFNPPIGDGIHAYINPTFNLVVVTVNDNALVTILRPESGHSKLLMAMGAVMDTQLELIKIFSGKTGSDATFSATSKPAPQKPGDRVQDFEFNEMIQKTAKGVKKEDAESFWDDVSESQEGAPTNLEGITYEDALKKGIVGKDDESGKK